MIYVKNLLNITKYVMFCLCEGVLSKEVNFILYKKELVENLDALKLSLIRCVDEGMIDLEDHYYNEVLDLIEEAKLISSWEELEEVVQVGKTLEIDIAAWLSLHGRTTVSLEWPHKDQANN